MMATKTETANLQISISTNTATLAKAMFEGSDLQSFNGGTYEGTAIPLRRMTGNEHVVIIGTTAGAKVTADETWIVDRFGSLGARQIRRLRALVGSTVQP